MIAGFRSWTGDIYQKLRGVHEVVRLPENSGLSRKQIETGRKALKILGIEEATGLGKNDLVIFLYAVGLNPTDDVIDSKMRAFKLHDLATFSFGQACHIWQSMLQDLTDEEEILRRAFQFFDKDGNGEISIPELRTTMHELGDLLSEEEILAFMAVMDVNNDGVIGFEEFISTLKTQTPELREADTAEGDLKNSMDRRIEAEIHTSINMASLDRHDEEGAQGAHTSQPAGRTPGPLSEGTNTPFIASQSQRNMHKVPAAQLIVAENMKEAARLERQPSEADNALAGAPSTPTIAAC